MSTTTIRPAPVRRSVTVNAAPAEAFRVFTADIAKWWPSTHSIGKAKMKNPVLEPRAGGRWYEIGEDGSECDWGRVLAWEPPARLLMAWQIDHGFGFNPDLHTEVEVRFIAEGARATRVELEHRLLERFREPAVMREKLNSGWPTVLAGYARLFDNQPGGRS
jgi:uncharacterized protein YndB with AHSA1/START domain